MIWSEPTRRQNFRPLISERRDRPLTRRMKRAPRRYARILDASYSSLKARSRRNLVIGGNSFTTGTSPRATGSNLRLPNGKPPRLDLYGHNPFSARRPLLDRPPLGHGFADFSDLDLLAEVGRSLAGPTAGQARIKFFLSELFWPTDHANHEFNFWVTRRTAASWLTDALRITRRWPRIYTLGWYALYDDPRTRTVTTCIVASSPTAVARSRRTGPTSVAEARQAAETQTRIIRPARPRSSDPGLADSRTL